MQYTLKIHHLNSPLEQWIFVLKHCLNTHPLPIPCSISTTTLITSYINIGHSIMYNWAGDLKYSMFHTKLGPFYKLYCINFLFYFYFFPHSTHSTFVTTVPVPTSIPGSILWIVHGTGRQERPMGVSQPSHPATHTRPQRAI